MPRGPDGDLDPDHGRPVSRGPPIRERLPADDAAIGGLNDAAFGGAHESRPVPQLRDAGLAAVDLVADEGGAIVGHIMLGALSVTIDGHAVRALALAPMCVRPGRQRSGIGSTLVRRGLERARHDGWQAVLVLGHADYY